MSRSWCLRAVAATVVLSVCAPSAVGSIIGFVLTGEGDKTGLPTSALVQIDIAPDGTTATFTVANTSPTSSGPAGSPDPPSTGDAPILTVFGFQADAEPGDFEMSTVTPADRFFDRSGHPSSLGAGGRFEFRVDAESPRPRNGLAVGESLMFELTALGDFVFSESVFRGAPLNNRGFLMGARLQVVGPDGEDSAVATVVPEPGTLVMLLGAVLLLRRRR